MAHPVAKGLVQQAEERVASDIELLKSERCSNEAKLKKRKRVLRYGFGCAMGKHRSVSVVEALKESLKISSKQEGYIIQVAHRELGVGELEDFADDKYDDVGNDQDKSEGVKNNSKVRVVVHMQFGASGSRSEKKKKKSRQKKKKLTRKEKEQKELAEKDIEEAPMEGSKGIKTCGQDGQQEESSSSSLKVVEVRTVPRLDKLLKAVGVACALSKRQLLRAQAFILKDGAPLHQLHEGDTSTRELLQEGSNVLVTVNEEM